MRNKRCYQITCSYIIVLHIFLCSFCLKLHIFLCSFCLKLPIPKKKCKFAYIYQLTKQNDYEIPYRHTGF